MCPITETKKKAAPTQTSELLNLQRHGMSEDSLRGRDEIAALTGERGKPAANPTQAMAREKAKKFFSKQAASKGSSSSSQKTQAKK